MMKKMINLNMKKEMYLQRELSEKAKKITSAENAEEALRYSLNNRGCVDFEYMKTLYPKEESEIIDELDNLIYQDQKG